MLGYDKIKLFRFIFKKQETSTMKENSFVIVTKNSIHAVADDGHEVGRVTGLELSKVMCLDASYLYVT